MTVAFQGPLGASTTKPSPEVQGTYKYRDGDFTITVGYMCPGATTADGVVDPYANYYALVTARKMWPMSLTRHAPWKLDVSLSTYLGLHLSDEAYNVLATDAATVPCA